MVLLLTSLYVKFVIPTVGLIDIKVLVPYSMDNSKAAELATSANSMFEVLIARVATSVCAVRLTNV